MGKRRVRKLIVDDATYLWTQDHRHQSADPVDTEGCSEHLVIRREGAPGRLEVVFISRHGASVAVSHAGSLRRGADNLNLHRPGTVRALLDAAISRGWQASDGIRVEIDGWTLFDDALARQAGDTSRRSGS